MTTPPDAPALDLDAIEARANAATPGPWCAGGSYVGIVRPWGNIYSVVGVQIVHEGWESRTGGIQTPVDAAFIAAARADIPALVAAVRALTAENARLRAAAVTALLRAL